MTWPKESALIFLILLNFSGALCTKFLLRRVVHNAPLVFGKETRHASFLCYMSAGFFGGYRGCVADFLWQSCAGSTGKESPSSFYDTVGGIMRLDPCFDAPCRYGILMLFLKAGRADYAYELCKRACASECLKDDWRFHVYAALIGRARGDLGAMTKHLEDAVHTPHAGNGVLQGLRPAVPDFVRHWYYASVKRPKIDSV